jgi:hypothetical protein
MIFGFPFANHAPAVSNRIVDIGASHPQFQALLARLDLMFSSAPMRPRSALLVFGIGLGGSGVWVLLPELLRSKPFDLPFDRNGTEAAAARRTRAVLAAEIGAIRGDLWASWPTFATPGRGTSLFSNLLWPMPIRLWPNGFAPASQNERGWPTAAASWKTAIKFACPSSPAGLDV